MPTLKEAGGQPESFHKDALDAFTQGSVNRTLRSTTWFTPSYIDMIHQTHPQPSRKPGFGSFENPVLRDLFIVDSEMNGQFQNETKYDHYRKIVAYLQERMIGSLGHLFTLKGIPFLDDEIRALCEELHLDENFVLQREMVGQVRGQVISLIAPAQVRDDVVKIACSWGEGYEEKRKNLLILSQLVRKGTQAFFRGK